MVRLETLIKLDSIVLDIPADSKRDAVDALSSLLQKSGMIIDSNVFLADIMEKEKEDNSNLGVGIALLYSKSNSVREVSAALGRLKNSISWEDDGEEVDAVLLLAIPENDTDVAHLDIVGSLSAMLKEITFVSDLYNANTRSELLESVDTHIQQV